MNIQFNTGRKYTAHGQRIIATLHDDLAITFHDLDRMIDGEIEARFVSQTDVRRWFADKLGAASVVMEHYDRSNYRSTQRSFDAAMYDHGENAAAKWEG